MAPHLGCNGTLSTSPYMTVKSWQACSSCPLYSPRGDLQSCLSSETLATPQMRISQGNTIGNLMYCGSTVSSTSSFVLEALASLLQHFKTSYCLVLLSCFCIALRCSTSSFTLLYSLNGASYVSSSFPNLSYRYLFAPLYSPKLSAPCSFFSKTLANNSSSCFILDALPPVLSVLQS